MTDTLVDGDTLHTLRISFRLNKNVLGFNKDLLCGAMYIPPEGSKYSDIDMFDCLTTDLINFNNDNQYYVLIIGDFNSRIGTQHYSISLD